MVAPILVNQGDLVEAHCHIDLIPCLSRNFQRPVVVSKGLGKVSLDLPERPKIDEGGSDEGLVLMNDRNSLLRFGHRDPKNPAGDHMPAPVWEPQAASVRSRLAKEPHFDQTVSDNEGMDNKEFPGLSRLESLTPGLIPGPENLAGHLKA